MSRMRTQTGHVVYSILPPSAPVLPGDLIYGLDPTRGNRLHGLVVSEVLQQIYDPETETGELRFRTNSVGSPEYTVGLSRTTGVGHASRPLPQVEVEVYFGEDGTPVIEIDTPGIREDGGGPICRVYLNDGEIYENPPFPFE